MAMTVPMSYLFSGSGSASKVGFRPVGNSVQHWLPRIETSFQKFSPHSGWHLFHALSCFRHFALTQKKGGRVGRGPLRASVQAQKVHRPFHLPQRPESLSARAELVVGTPMEIGQFLRVAIGLSAAVRHLHGR